MEGLDHEVGVVCQRFAICYTKIYSRVLLYEHLMLYRSQIRCHILHELPRNDTHVSATAVPGMIHHYEFAVEVIDHEKGIDDISDICM